jgi:hypothetical protein
MYDPYYLCVFLFVVMVLFVIFMYVFDNYVWSVK